MEQLIKVGNLKSIKSNEVTFSKFGIDLPKLDRIPYDASKTYDKLQNIGVKFLRLNSGWQKCEKEKGKYDFAWLDEIVNNFLKRGIQPWLILAFGNELYSEKAKDVFGAIGIPPIFSEEEKEGWRNFCKAIAKHFKGRVDMFEIWNEPDMPWCWKHGPSGKEYGNFVIETCKAVRKENENAYMIGGSMACKESVWWLEEVFQTGAGKYLNAISYHIYSPNQMLSSQAVKNFKAIFKKYDLNLELIQGEQGTPSNGKGYGALCKGIWNEYKQAKMLLCRQVTDLGLDLKFTSWFSTVDLIEGLNGNNHDLKSHLDYGYFGILSAKFDENGVSIGDFEPKKSYFAYQNLCSLLGKNFVKNENVPILPFKENYSELIYDVPVQPEDIEITMFKKDSGAWGASYFKRGNILQNDFESVTSLLVDYDYEKLRIVDPMTGEIYRIPEVCSKKHIDGVYKLFDIPIKDYPLFLVKEDFIE